jgi:hypothetical protein
VQVEPRKQKAFFDLPRELRDNIYHLCSARSSSKAAGRYKQLCHSLLAICRTVREEGAPIFWKDRVEKHELYWNFRNYHVSEIKAFPKAMCPFTTATQMCWFARANCKVRRNRFKGTRSVTSKVLIAVLHQRSDGDKVLEQVARDCQEHFDRFTEHGAVTFLASGEVCGVIWKRTLNTFALQESVELRGPLAQLNWDFIATGEGEHRC